MGIWVLGEYVDGLGVGVIWMVPFSTGVGGLDGWGMGMSDGVNAR